MNATHKIVAATVSVIFAVAGVTTTAAANDDSALKTGSEVHIPTCEYEDASTDALCYWDATTQGNGEGESFIAHDYGRVLIYMDTGRVVFTDKE